MDNSIPFSQKLYFLAIHPEKGGIASWSYTAIDYVILGSLFMELYMDGKIKFEGKRIIVKSTKADSTLHRFLLNKLNSSKSPRKISTWINRLYYSLKYIRTEVQDGLVQNRLIKMEAKRFLFFKWKKPVVINKQVLYKFENQVTNLISKGTEIDEELILLSFLEPAGLLYRLYRDRKKRKEAKALLKKMMVKNNVSGAVADAIAASQAVAASVAVTVAATSAVTS